jgi:uncharacterized protein
MARNNWIETSSGRMVYPLAPHPDQIVFADIAHALSRQCRFNGHINAEHYSVAEHSILVAQLVSPENKLWALLHDASESFLGDMVNPLKIDMPDFREAERRMQEVIYRKYGLEGEMPEEVHRADMVVLANEREVLFNNHDLQWHLPYSADPSIAIRCLPPNQAREEFVRKFFDEYFKICSLNL